MLLLQQTHSLHVFPASLYCPVFPGAQSPREKNSGSSITESKHPDPKLQGQSHTRQPSGLGCRPALSTRCEHLSSQIRCEPFLVHAPEFTPPSPPLQRTSTGSKQRVEMDVTAGKPWPSISSSVALVPLCRVAKGSAPHSPAPT